MAGEFEVRGKISGESASFERTSARAEKALQSLAKTTNDTAKSAAKLSDVLQKEVSKSLENVAANAGPLGGVLTKLGPAGMAAAAGIGAAVAAVTALGKAAQDGSQYSNVQRAFDRLAKGVGESGDKILGTTRTMSAGLISNFDIMQTANKGFLLGLPITASEMGTLAKTAITLGQAMNVGPGQALSDLVTGLGRGSAAILDNLGIQIKAEDAYKRYAAQIGTSVEKLTEHQKTLAVYKVALEESAKSVDKLGGFQQTAGEKMTQLTVEVKNAYAEFSNMVAKSESVNRAIESVTGYVKELVNAIKALANSGFSGIFDDIRKGMGAVIDEQKRAMAGALARMFNPYALAGQTYGGTPGPMGVAPPKKKPTAGVGAATVELDKLDEILIRNRNDTEKLIETWKKFDEELQASAMASRLNVAMLRSAMEQAALSERFMSQGVSGYDALPGLSGMLDTPGSALTAAQANAAHAAKYGAKNLADSTKSASKNTKEMLNNLAPAVQLASQMASMFFDMSGRAAAIGGALGSAAGSIFGPVGGQIGGVIGGVIGSIFDRGKKREEERKKREADMKSAIDSMKGLAEEFKRLQREMLERGTGGLAAMFRSIAKQTDVSAERMERLGRIGMGVFAALRASGMSTVEAMEAMGDALDAAIAAAEKTGRGLGALASLAQFRQLVLDNKELVAGIEGLGLALEAVRSQGLLTAELFADFQAEAAQGFQDLIAAGFTVPQALALMAPMLLTLVQAAQALGLNVDDMLNEITGGHAEEAKEALAGMQSPMDKLLVAQNMMLLAIAALVQAFGRSLPDAVQKYIDKLNEVPTLPPAPTGGGNPNPDSGENPERGFAGGGISSGPMSGHWELLHGKEAIVPMNGGGDPFGALQAQMMGLRNDIRYVLPKAIRDSVQQGSV